MRFAVSGQRVAPTQKISDDASFPQRQLERQLAPGSFTLTIFPA